jgi:hypothetical protein
MMKHDKTDRDLTKDVNMPGSSGSQGSESDRLRKGNLEESEVGAASGNPDSSSGRQGSSGSSSGSRSGSSGSQGDINR